MHIDEFSFQYENQFVKYVRERVNILLLPFVRQFENYTNERDGITFNRRVCAEASHHI